VTLPRKEVVMSRRVVSAILLLTFGVASCRTWAPVQAPPGPVPESVRIELLSGERVRVADVRIEADTLVGRVVGGNDTIRVPIEQIDSMEASRFSFERTFWAVLGGTAAAAGLLLYVAFSNWSGL
jgi:hypothetical protein